MKLKMLKLNWKLLKEKQIDQLNLMKLQKKEYLANIKKIKVIIQQKTATIRL